MNITIDALKQSITHWEHIRDGLEHSYGSADCALCELYYEIKCEGCPVQVHTKISRCDDTPYVQFTSHRKLLHGDKKGILSDEWCETCERLAHEEVVFLGSLLSKQYKHKAYSPLKKPKPEPKFKVGDLVTSGEGDKRIVREFYWDNITSEYIYACSPFFILDVSEVWTMPNVNYTEKSLRKTTYEIGDYVTYNRGGNLYVITEIEGDCIRVLNGMNGWRSFFYKEPNIIPVSLSPFQNKR